MFLFAREGNRSKSRQMRDNDLYELEDFKEGSIKVKRYSNRFKHIYYKVRTTRFTLLVTIEEENQL